MIYTHDISRALSHVAGEQGVDKAQFDTTLGGTEKIIRVLQKQKETGVWPVLTVPERTDDLDAVEDAARRIRSIARTLVVIGMGGSSRGGRMLAALTLNPFTHRYPSGMAIHFVDNIDPATSSALLESVDLASAFFLIVSKSGDTAETLAHLLVLLEKVGTQLGTAAIRERFLAIAMPGDNTLRRLAAAHAIAVLEHDPAIGGRFSALTAVGLLPACVAGLNIRAVRAGAQSVIEDLFAGPAPEPARGAALHYAMEQLGKPISVLMPYCDRLEAFGSWYQQLVAESLGKGGKGLTPIASLGALDQHSQLQLYLDGPRDKLLTLILLAQADKGPAIPPAADATLAYLGSHTVGDLMDAEQRATAETLSRNHCPLRLFMLPRLDEEALGALAMHFMLETMILAQLWSINAFDQPAVEESKQLAWQYLMRTRA